jgi:hypothetical protein
MTDALEPAGRPLPARGPRAVSNSTRVLVAFPFSTITVNETRDAADLAELLARACFAIADGGSPEELRALGTEAQDLAARLRRP